MRVQIEEVLYFSRRLFYCCVLTTSCLAARKARKKEAEPLQEEPLLPWNDPIGVVGSFIHESKVTSLGLSV